FRYEPSAVRLAAGDGGKEPASLHLSAVGGDAGDLGLAAFRGGRRLGAEQALELHGASARFLLGGNRTPPARHGFLLCPAWGVKRAKGEGGALGVGKILLPARSAGKPRDRLPVAPLQVRGFA